MNSYIATKQVASIRVLHLLVVAVQAASPSSSDTNIHMNMHVYIPLYTDIYRVYPPSIREVKSICGAHCCWCGAKIEIGRWCTRLQTRVSGVGSWGVQNGPSPVYEPDAPPRVTEVKTGGATLGPIVLSLLFLLAVERMLEPLLLPLDKDGPTEDLVCVV
jgi:hypothetical protein